MLSATDSADCLAHPVRRREGSATAEGKEKDIIGRKTSKGGRHACSTMWESVVSNAEVGGEEEQEKEEEGVLPLQSGLSCWCIPVALVRSNRKPWYKKPRRRGNPPKCLSAAAWPGPRAWECGLNKTMPSLIVEPLNTQHFIMDRDDRKRNKNMWVKLLLYRRAGVSSKCADSGLDENSSFFC